MKVEKIDKTRIILAAASGLMLTGSFPNIDFGWLIWIAFVPLLIAIRNCGVKKSFVLGFATGMVHYMTLLYWVVYTMRTYGYLPWPVCVLILILFSMVLAAYIAVFSVAVSRMQLMPVAGLITIPSVWVGLEWVRSFFLTGFPWESIGHSQYHTLHIIQISDTLGAYGISFLVLLVNTALFFLYLSLRRYDWHGTLISRRFAAVSLAGCLLLLGLDWLYGAHRLSAVDQMVKSVPAIRLKVIQGNIEQSLKWNPKFQISTIEKHLHLSQSTGDQKPDLIIWPETALPFYFQHNVPLTTKVSRGIQEIGTYFITGSPSFARRIHRIDYYNSAYLIGPDGIPLEKYDKTHLVPFGEYVPLKRWLPFLDKLVEQVGDFDRGEVGDTITWKDNKLGILICYELIFPYISRAMVRNGATLLINITNDAWYGRSSAPYQHFSMAVFRAVENRRALVRSANTGISGFIDPAGRIQTATPLFEEAAATQNVPILSGLTFYTRFGDVFAKVCLAIAAMALLYQEMRRRKTKKA